MGEAKRRGKFEERVKNPRGICKTKTYNQRMAWKLITNPDYPGIQRSHDGKTFYETLPSGTLQKISREEILRRFPPKPREEVRIERK